MTQAQAERLAEILNWRKKWNKMISDWVFYDQNGVIKGAGLDAMFHAEESLAEYPSREREEYFGLMEAYFRANKHEMFGNRVISLAHAPLELRLSTFFYITRYKP